jgi:peptidoglycan/LPS O-acetylase OafA/YrhL
VFGVTKSPSTASARFFGATRCKFLSVRQSSLLCLRRFLAMLPSLLAQLSSSLVLLSALIPPSSLALLFSPAQLSSLTWPSSLVLLFSPAQLSSSPAPISSLD